MLLNNVGRGVGNYLLIIFCFNKYGILDLFPLLASLINVPLYEEEVILAHKIFVNILHSINNEYELTQNLYEYYRPLNLDNAFMDIIFVHGKEVYSEKVCDYFNIFENLLNKPVKRLDA